MSPNELVPMQKKDRTSIFRMHMVTIATAANEPRHTRRHALTVEHIRKHVLKLTVSRLYTGSFGGGCNVGGRSSEPAG